MIDQAQNYNHNILFLLLVIGFGEVILKVSWMLGKKAAFWIGCGEAKNKIKLPLFSIIEIRIRIYGRGFC